MASAEAFDSIDLKADSAGLSTNSDAVLPSREQDATIDHTTSLTRSDSLGTSPSPDDAEPLQRNSSATLTHSRLSLGGRRLAMSPGDAVVPLCCGICSHSLIAALLLGCVIAYEGLERCSLSSTFAVYLYTSFCLHCISIVLSGISACIALQAKVLSRSLVLERLLSFRIFLNILELALVAWGLALIYSSRNHKCLTRAHQGELETLLLAAVFFNFGGICVGFCAGFCLSQGSTRYERKHEEFEVDPSRRSDTYWRCFRRACKCFFWEERHDSRVDETYGRLGALVTTLLRGNPRDTIRLAPSDVVTGLHLHKMLQKHYGLFDKRFYRPLPGYQYVFDSDAIYYKQLGFDAIDPIDASDANSDEMDENGAQGQQKELCIDAEAKRSSLEYKREKGRIRSELYKGKQPRLSPEETDDIEEGKYYMLWAEAAYGIALYTLERPCAICCAPPCGMPRRLGAAVDALGPVDDANIADAAGAAVGAGAREHENRVIRDKGMCPDWRLCCCGHDAACSMSNSSLKVFLQRVGARAEDVLIVHHARQLSKVHFIVCVDRVRANLVVAVRGTESFPDAVIDADCAPELLDEVHDECLVHSGILSAAKVVYDVIMHHVAVRQFLKYHPDFGVIVCGHSLGAGVTALLTLMLKHNSKALEREMAGGVGAEAAPKNRVSNLELFRNRRIHGYAFAPPAVVAQKYCKMIETEMQEFLTCFIYSKDLVPRLSFIGTMRIRAAINRLLKICSRSSWWIYERSLRVKYSSIIEAVRPNSMYIRSYAAPGVPGVATVSSMNVLLDVNDADETNANTGAETKEDDETERDRNDRNSRNNGSEDDSGRGEKKRMPGETEWIRDISEDLIRMKKDSIRHKLLSRDIWETHFAHIGKVYHIVRFGKDNERSDHLGPMEQSGRVAASLRKDNENRGTSMMEDFDDSIDVEMKQGGCCARICNIIGYWCALLCKYTLCNFLRGKLCVQLHDTRYTIYRADPYGFGNNMLISRRMLPDHMPQCYSHSLGTLVLEAKNAREH